MCTRIERNFNVPDFLKDNSERYGFMLNRDPANANFKDWDPVEEKMVDNYSGI
jgi:hypothetical protein